MQDRIAERAFYESLFAAKPGNEHINFGYEELHDLAFAVPGRKDVLDLGCGTGAHAVRLARRGFRVFCIDLTLEGVRQTRARLREAGFPGLVLVADAERLPLRDGGVDTVWSSLLLHHFTTLDRLPEEMRRVARQSIVAFEPNAQNLLTWVAFNVVNRIWGIAGMTPNQRALTPSGLKKVFSRFGFTVFRVHYVDRGWSDAAGLIRRAYRSATRWLPERIRTNKFLFIAELPSP
jgi:SAM-dependent methyltransferase